jgi:hypothetical protein
MALIRALGPEPRRRDARADLSRRALSRDFRLAFRPLENADHVEHAD